MRRIVFSTGFTAQETATLAEPVKNHVLISFGNKRSLKLMMLKKINKGLRRKFFFYEISIFTNNYKL